MNEMYITFDHIKVQLKTQERLGIIYERLPLDISIIRKIAKYMKNTIYFRLIKPASFKFKEFRHITNTSGLSL